MRLKSTLYQKILETLTLLVWAATIILFIVLWGDLPDEVPVHYDIRGEIDGWGSKYALLGVPIAGGIIFLVFFVILRIPKIWNVPFKIDGNDKEMLYTSARNLTILLNLEFSLSYFYISLTTLQGQEMEWYFTAAELVVIPLTVVYFICEMAMTARYAKRKISIDSEVTRLKNTFPVSKYWLIIPCVLAVIPFFILTAENGNSGFIFAVIIVFEVLSLIAGYIHSTRIKSKIFSEDESVNLAVNRLRIRGLSKAFVSAAYIASFSGLGCYSSLFNNGFIISGGILFVFFAHIAVILFCFRIAQTKINNAVMSFVTDGNTKTVIEE